MQAPSAARSVAGIGLGWLVLSAATALGQEPAVREDVPADKVLLDTLQVRVERSGRPVRWIAAPVTRLELANRVAAQRGLSLDESLREVPGLAVSNRRNEAQGDRLAVRGTGARAAFGVRGIKLLLDGVPLTLADGQAVLYNLDPAALRDVEILRGPSAVRYGNASGGVLAFRTYVPDSGRLSAYPLIQVGSYGYLRWRVGVAAPIGDASLRLDVGQVRMDGWRDYSTSDIRRLNLMARGDGRHTRWFGTLNVHDLPWAENPGSLDAETSRAAPRSVREFQVTQGAGKSSTQGQFGAGVEHDVGSVTLAATGWGLRRDMWNPIATRIISLDRGAAGVRTEARGRRGSRLSWVAGVDVEWLGDDRTENQNDGVPSGRDRPDVGELILEQRETVLAAAPFVDLQVSVARSARITASARWDNYRFRATDRKLDDGDDSGERTFGEFSPAVGLALSSDPRWTAFAAFSTSFTTPTTSEFSNNPDGTGGFNPDLRPEKLRMLEVGARGLAAGGRLTLDISAYSGRVAEALVPREGPTEEVFFSNAGNVSRAGLEIGAAWNPAEPWWVRLSASKQRNRFREFTVDGEDYAGRTEPGSPMTWVLTEVRWKPAAGAWLQADLRWIDRYPVNDANSEYNPASTVLDFKAGYRTNIGRTLIDLYAGVDNVAGTRYNGSVVPNAFGERYFEPASSTEMYAGLTVAVD